MPANIRRATERGLQSTVIEQSGVSIAYTALWPDGDETEAALAGRCAAFLSESGTAIVKCDVFGPCVRYKQFVRALAAHLPPPCPPVTWVEGLSCNGAPLAGILVRSVAGARVDTVCLDSGPVARTWEDATGRYCIAGGINSGAPGIMPAQQTQLTLEALESALNAAGMDTTNLVRTWFYNDRLLEWYGAFNAVRTRFYRDRGIFEKLLPASTGIGGRNPHDTALVVAAEAIAFKVNGASVREISSPLQNQALGYGSAFSRAVEIETPGLRRLLISGTASINERGETVFKGDTAAQIDQTIRVVQAILESRSMNWADTVRAIAYVKNPGDAGTFSGFLRERSFPQLPWIIAKNDVCRDDLLFEIEVDAVKGF
jgi:enamine deaminase RidA (YjgF/YER057c/UK114 family)